MVLKARCLKHTYAFIFSTTTTIALITDISKSLFSITMKSFRPAPVRWISIFFYRFFFFFKRTSFCRILCALVITLRLRDKDNLLPEHPNICGRTFRGIVKWLLGRPSRRRRRCRAGQFLSLCSIRTYGGDDDLYVFLFIYFDCACFCISFRSANTPFSCRTLGQSEFGKIILKNYFEKRITNTISSKYF